MKQKFTLYWLDGNREPVEGTTFTDAMNKAGYGAGALRALDFHAKGDCQDYVWGVDSVGRKTWIMTEEAKKRLFGL